MTTSPADQQLRRIERDTLVAGGLLTLGALMVWPHHQGRAAGVSAGLMLIALSYRGIRSGVDRVWPRSPGDGRANAEGGESVPSRSQFGFVKFFTRHAILAVSAYVMMARFEFDPMAMLVGVTTPAIAASVECVRIMRARSVGSHSRLS